MTGDALDPKRLKRADDIGYRFDDHDVDFMFQWSLGATRTGGPDSGELVYIAAGIDGSVASLVRQFEGYGDIQRELGAELLDRGRRHGAGEALMKAHHCYRQAWQFAAQTERFFALIDKYESAFVAAVSTFDLPLHHIDIPYGPAPLPALLLDAGPDSPTLIVIGGGDTGREDLYHLMGFPAWQRGYTTVMVDLPGQGSTPLRGLHLIAEAERPVAAVVDHLVDAYGQDLGRLALMGCHGGGYAVSRAVMTERRIAACIASTPISSLGEVLPLHLAESMAAAGTVSAAFDLQLWRSGRSTPVGYANWLSSCQADPHYVRCPFLSLVCGAEEPQLIQQAEQWHAALPVEHKTLIALDTSSAPDARCPADTPTRLARQACDWLDDLFSAGQRSEGTSDPRVSSAQQV